MRFSLSSPSSLRPADRATDLRTSAPHTPVEITDEAVRRWDLDGRGVVITGAAGGIGAAVARGFAAVGAREFLVDLEAPYGITVDAVAPGEVRTPMLLTGLSPGAYEAMGAQIPLGYIAEPTNIRGICLFLASRHSGSITGAASINVTGGMQPY